MVATKKAVHVVDAAIEPAYIERHPAYIAAVELGGVRTYLTVPMLKDNELIGVFSLIPSGGTSLYRKADCACHELRRPSRHRHRERAPARRTARILTAADRDWRCAQGHQPLHFRPADCAQYPDQVSGALLRGQQRGHVSGAGWRRASDGRQLWLFARGGTVREGRTPGSPEPR